jgi:hypothetical protein
LQDPTGTLYALDALCEILRNWMEKLDAGQDPYTTAYMQFQQLHRDELGPGIDRCLSCVRELQAIFAADQLEWARTVETRLRELKMQIGEIANR